MDAVHGGDIYRNHVRIDFSVNINPLGVPKGVEDALYRAVGHCREYPDMTCEALKKAVGAMRAVREDCLLFGNGASELFMAAVHAIKPQKILLPVPSFYGYEHAARAAGAEIRYFPLREEEGFALPERLKDALNSGIDMLFLANPNNPTGTLTGREYLRGLLSLCREKGIWVLLDECFIDFAERGESMLPELETYDKLLIIQAFTKIFSIPGVRIGYAACSNAGMLEKLKRQLPEWNLSAFAQEAGIACAGEVDFIEKTKCYVADERKYLTEGLRRAGVLVYGSEANFLLVHSERPLYCSLLEKGLLIRDCKSFTGLPEGYYRIAVKSRRENEELMKVIGELQ